MRKYQLAAHVQGAVIVENADIDHGDLVELLRNDWALDEHGLEFLPVGGSSWSYRAGDWFVNVRDAMDRGAPWDTPRDVSVSFAAAAALRDRCGLDFVLAPTPTLSGGSSSRLGDSLVVVTPFVDGEVRGWGPFARDELEEATGWVASIHAATPVLGDLPLFRRPFEDGFGPYLRAALEAACRDPESEFRARLRALVEPHRNAIGDALAAHEANVAQLRAAGHEFVVTHAEPDPQNVLEEPSGRRWLVDLGEIALAPREVDWSVLRRAARPRDADIVPKLDPVLARYFDSRYNLSEITEYLFDLERSDGSDVDFDRAWDWRSEPEPQWRTAGQRQWGLLSYFLGTFLSPRV